MGSISEIVAAQGSRVLVEVVGLEASLKSIEEGLLCVVVALLTLAFVTAIK